MNPRCQTHYIKWIIKWRWPILLAWMVLILFFAFHLIRFLLLSATPIDNSVSIWFQQNDPELVQYERFNKDFGESEWTVLLLKTESIEDDGFLNQLKDLTEEIESVPNVQKTISLANVRGVVVGDDGTPQNWPILDSYHERQNRHTGFKSFLARYPGLIPVLYRAEDDSHTVILIKTDNLIGSQTKYRLRLLDQIRDLVTAKPLVKDHALAGTAVINAELNRAAERDAMVFYLLISGFLVFLVLFTLKHFRDGLTLMAIVIGTIIPVMGGLAFFEIPFNMISIMLPTLLAALSVADIVHVIDVFHVEWQGSPGTIESSLATTIGLLWKPGLWTSLTTAVGLLALTGSDVIPVFQIGVAGPIGILWAWLQTVIIGPILLSLIWYSSYTNETRFRPKQSTQGMYQRLVDWMIDVHHRHPRKLLVGLGLMVLPVLALPWLEVDTNYAKFFRGDSTLPMDYAKVQQAGFSQNPLSIQLSINHGKDITTSGIYPKIRLFEKKLESLLPINGILSATTLLDGIVKSLPRSDFASEVMKDGRQDRMAAVLKVARDYAHEDLADFVLPHGRQVQIVALTNYLSSKELEALKEKIQNLAADTFTQGDITLSVTGTTVLWASMDKHVSKTQLQSIIFAFGFMALFLPIIFKSFKLGLLGVLINFLPVSVALGVMALSNIKVSIATALIGSIAFGIVVDDTIHFLTRFNVNRLKGLTVTASVAETLEVIGRSIVTTTLILVGSFITLSSSSFLPSAHFGIFIALSVSLALYLDIFILPLVIPRICREKASL